MSLDHPNKPQQMYIELLKKSLSGFQNLEMGLRVSYLLHCMDTSTAYDLDHVINISKYEQDVINRLLEDPDGRDNYRERVFGFPATMIGKARLDNLEFCIKTVLADNVPGDFMETGVWRGGATIFMRGMLEAMNNEDKKVWVADSFRGLPEPILEQDGGLDFYLDPILSVSRDIVEENFRRYDLLDDRVNFIEGWFEDSMPLAPVEKLSILRLDGDLYKSTMDVLDSMYEKVTDGGFVIIDDYGAIDACRQAVHDFRSTHGINDKITDIDWTGSYWRKGEGK